MTILQKLSAFAPKCHMATIEGTEFKFYSPRLRTIMSGQLAEVLRPVGKALAVLFADKENDNSRQYERGVDGSQTTFTQASSPETLKLRNDQTQAAIDDILKTLVNDDLRYKLGMLLADSLRDDFPKEEAERAKMARAFMDELSPGTFVQFMMGYFKAIAPLMDAEGNSILSAVAKRVNEEMARRGVDLNERKGPRATTPEAAE